MLILFEVVTQCFAERHGLGGDDVDQRAALHAGKQFSVDFLRVLFLAKYQATARSAQGFVRRCRNVIAVRHWGRMKPGDDQSGYVRNVGEHTRLHALRNFADALKIDYTRVGRRATDD